MVLAASVVAFFKTQLMNVPGNLECWMVWRGGKHSVT